MIYVVFDISGVQQLLFNANIGFIGPEMVGIIVVIITAIMINKGTGDLKKTLITLAPVSILLWTLGFQVHLIFILFSFITYVTYTLVASSFREHTIETEG